MEQQLIDEYNRGLTDGARMNLKGETAYLEARIRGLEEKLKDAMHWQPMTEDAVFEDGVEYLIRVVDEPLAVVCTYRHTMQVPFNTDIMDYNRDELTHYARITEPK